MTLAKTHVYSARDSIFFCNRVINIWNALPDSIIKSPSVNNFKSKIISVIFVLIVLFDYLGGGGPMLVQASAFGS